MKGSAVRAYVGGVAAWGLVVAFLLGTVSVGWAGVEPSPFRPATNVLDSVANVLSAEEANLEAALHPPDPCVPPDPCLVGKLDAITLVLLVQFGRVESVLGTPPPDDGIPADFGAALEEVSAGAWSITALAVEGLTVPPEPCLPPEVLEALAGLGRAAWGIAATADAYSAGGMLDIEAWLAATAVLNGVADELGQADRLFQDVLAEYPFTDPDLEPVLSDLRVVTGTLAVQLGRVDGVLSLMPPPDDSIPPPDDGKPPPDDNVPPPVGGVPPDDGIPAEFLAALGQVRTGAAGIAAEAEPYLDPALRMPEAVRAGLMGVDAAAQAIVERVDAYLSPS